jgi:hypothetical protein
MRLDRTDTVIRFAKEHRKAWKQASKTKAEIIYEIVCKLLVEGHSREGALDLAQHTLRYMRRYF